MKKFSIILFVLGFFLTGNSASASTTYQETIDVYTYSVGGIINWAHTYDHTADPVEWATLTIVADDVDAGELDLVSIQDSGGIWHELGYLNDMGYYTNWSYSPGPGNPNQPLTVTTFNLDPSWIDGLPVRVNVASYWGVEIETSTLTMHQVPAPGALLLGSIGTGLLGLLRRRRAL